MTKPIHQLDLIEQLEIAESPTASKDALRYLGYSTSFMTVLEAVLENPRCPRELLERVASDNFHELHFLAEEILKSRTPK
ncbi:hypothetical protein ICM05_05350 [Leucobacter sp. cx-42]|nr:hypothetical protein [Leucobacter sp. cx-42]